MTDPAALATRYAGRPLLMLPQAAEDLARRIRAIDPQAFSRPSRLDAILRRLGGLGMRAPLARGGVQAMEDDDFRPPVPMQERLAYAPLYIGTPEDTGFCWSLSQGVALMCADTALAERGTEICGEVYHGYDTLLEGMREALADDRVKGLFLRLDTPGGVVAGGLDTLHRFMMAAREQAGGKPIWTYADMAASAGYWVASPSDRIIAPRVGYVGSIGAVIVHASYAGALTEDGVKVTAIQFGAEKTDGAWWADLSDRARETLQSDVDQCGRNFVAAVSAARPVLTPEALIATQAAVYMAEHDDAARSGLALHFVDALADEEEAFAELVEHVSGSARPKSPAPSNGSPQAAAPKGRAPAASQQEAPMANRQRTTAPGASRPRAEDEAAESEAEGATAPSEEDESGEESRTDRENEPEVAGDEADDAQAIAASAEAEAHPQLALEAIRTGLTLPQFQAMAKAAGKAPKASRLDAALAGTRRLGADGRATPSAGENPYGSSLTARAAERRKQAPAR